MSTVELPPFSITEPTTLLLPPGVYLVTAQVPRRMTTISIRDPNCVNASPNKVEIAIELQYPPYSIIGPTTVPGVVSRSLASLSLPWNYRSIVYTRYRLPIRSLRIITLTCLVTAQLSRRITAGTHWQSLLFALVRFELGGSDKRIQDTKTNLCALLVYVLVHHVRTPDRTHHFSQ